MNSGAKAFHVGLLPREAHEGPLEDMLNEVRVSVHGAA